jgi:ribosomal-protein-alanine N-acetyltransferase
MAGQDDVPAILRYYLENREHLAPYEPAHPDFFYTEGFWRDRAERDLEDFKNDQSLRLLVFARDSPGEVVATIGFTGFVRGAGHLCNLGYSVARTHEGKGYMSEGVRAAVEHVFAELNMHRVIAGYMPHNRRSGNLLRRLGFTVEGYSRDFLLIQGRWEDHIQTALLNPRWIPA